jgi:hypothetical protein
VPTSPRPMSLHPARPPSACREARASRRRGAWSVTAAKITSNSLFAHKGGPALQNSFRGGTSG